MRLRYKIIWWSANHELGRLWEAECFLLLILILWPIRSCNCGTVILLKDCKDAIGARASVQRGRLWAGGRGVVLQHTRARHAKNSISACWVAPFWYGRVMSWYLCFREIRSGCQSINTYQCHNIALIILREEILTWLRYKIVLWSANHLNQFENSIMVLALSLKYPVYVGKTEQSIPGIGRPT